MAVEIVQCPTCSMKYRLDPQKFSQNKLRIRCKKCGNSFEVELSAGSAPEGSAVSPPPPPTPPSTPVPALQVIPGERPSEGAAPSPREKGLVLVSHEQKEVREEIVALLQEEGYEVMEARDGLEALTKIVEKHPQVAILDVALPRMFGFEVCEIVRRDRELDAVKLLLIAAIFDRTRYKRTPQTLYGADDYIEKHHIPDALLDKVQRLIVGGAAPVREEQMPRVVPPEVEKKEEEMRTRLRSLEEEGLAPELLERARRLARIIVSDIALYNQEKIEEGLKAGTLKELLKEELKEGEELLRSKLKGEISDGFPFLEEALEEFIRSKGQG